ncbi:ATP-binding cassette domain-containing protein [Plebeiibacterium marinum]|uniref:ATP-binding cassette domain-containing protein n=1 Tax=Plebeiibacterium marinum TaxID=2992111 RepID=A0AAE3MFP3_9BACT|nr:ATP-binding cassette domain-containing protein [Plebeiobacterium marinum]MCW3806721.1 ATP-binding cassette domain-containing protein [Plebeiobacterium marinum]
MKHYAIESQNFSVKGNWIKHLLKGRNTDLPEFQGKKGLLFSTITLEKMIEEEFLHDDFALTSDPKRSIRTYSSGEQRKALLQYLFKQKPDFLVLDNPFDCLDVESVAALKQQLIEISEQLPLIQLFKRKSDLMPFVTDVLIIEKEKLINSFTIGEFKKRHLHLESTFLQGSIPAPIKRFSNTPNELVKLQNVTVHYDGRCILNNINWTINKGEFWHLIGPNGSGKTTLLTMIYGDNPKAFGQDIYIFGNKKGSGESVWDIKEKIGYFTPSMTERFHSSQTVEQMVISGLVDSVGLYLKPSDMQRNLAQQWLKVLGLLNKKDERFYKLSQINQRMVLIARAMIKHPPLLVLDEPSTGLDDIHASLMVQLIQKIAEESETAILYVSHRKEEGLLPQYVYKLNTNEGGSEGIIL